ncbi:hypothetical protein GCM10023187_09930 [Nibrella viscosa]|uniref:Putative auto-transporter adhesin head GIN domain-containing protein n=1 Tax=Nibrella viscosa TaxID=1084524 RepID=A0ABP8K0D6_9BACT
MKRQFIHTIFALLLAGLTACENTFIGPYEETRQTYGLTGFDRLDMGSAFRITVTRGSTFAIEAKGNQRDIEDLDIYTRNGTLYAKYRNPLRSRRYSMNIDITMPELRGVDFSGASKSTVTGFTNVRELDVKLSGASKSTVEVTAGRLNIDLSGASDLFLKGNGGVIRGELSGASKVEAYDFPVDEADLDLSGASNAYVRVDKNLTVKASGASDVRYRGTPVVRSQVSGASKVRQD